jgi:hypothetical protein
LGCPDSTGQAGSVALAGVVMADKNTMPVKQPSCATTKVLQVPKLVRKDKAMPVKGKGK